MTTATAVPRHPRDEVVVPQLRRRAVLGVWAVAALPMAVLSWGVAPLVAEPPRRPGAAGRAR